MRAMAVILAMCLILTGCGTLFNPYKSEFDCPIGDKGKCISVPNAYNESVGGRSQIDNSEGKAPDKNRKKTDGSGPLQDDSRDIYQQEMAKKLAEYIKHPETPLLTPPAVMRALILPYRASTKELYSERYIYFLADDPQWVISAPTYGTVSGDMILEKPNTQTKR
jgi:conjugal transfer pilus assembly protein TraV